MSTWWRPCRRCGAAGDDARQCRACGEFAPFGHIRTPDEDGRLLTGLLVTGVLVFVAIMLVAAFVVYLGGT